MYLALDRTENNAQLQRRLIGWGIPLLVLLAFVVVVFINDLGIQDPASRREWLASLLSVLTGALFIFAYGMYISPVLAYRKHLRNVLDGRKREIRGAFKKIGDVPVLREGVLFYPVIISVGDSTDEEDDRLLYYDANKPKPDWRTGLKLIISAHDRTIAAYSAAE